MSLVNGLFNNLAKHLSRADETEGGAPFPHVDLFYWKPAGNRLNFGDHLAKIIVGKLLAEHGHMLEEETSAHRRLLAIGSILHFADDGDVVWGSGINGKVDLAAHQFKNLDVRAVRGKLTRDFLVQRGIAVPDVYGDPALLLPHLFPGCFVKNIQTEYVVVPNLHDLLLTQKSNMQHIVSPLWSWNRCVEQILKGELVIASSLHGLIIAEAYGVPARYLRLSEEESIFKYNDYMSGTGRAEITPAFSIEEALEMGGMAPPKFDPKPLLKAFPLDLWDGPA